jgi:hypothetical protein
MHDFVADLRDITSKTANEREILASVVEIGAQ